MLALLIYYDENQSGITIFGWKGTYRIELLDNHDIIIFLRVMK